jgi:hypothetical protein
MVVMIVDARVVTQRVDVRRQLLWKRKCWQQDRNYVSISADRLGDLLSQPVVLTKALIKRARRQDHKKIWIFANFFK